MTTALRHDRRLLLAAAGLAMFSAVPAIAVAQSLPAEVRAELPTARLQGSGRLTFLGLRVYDSRLWVGPGFTPEAFERHPFALELIYLRSLDGKQIAERSLVEMKKTGAVPEARGATWLADMAATFPDVHANDRITAVYEPAGSLKFFLNGKLLREFRDAEFARSFLGIWLSAKTSEPALRQALLGMKSGG